MAGVCYSCGYGEILARATNAELLSEDFTKELFKIHSDTPIMKAQVLDIGWIEHKNYEVKKYFYKVMTLVSTLEWFIIQKRMFQFQLFPNEDTGAKACEAIEKTLIEEISSCLNIMKIQ